MTLFLVTCDNVPQVRSGVKRLRVIDFDQLSLSSLNRHAVANWEDVGFPKVFVFVFQGPLPSATSVGLIKRIFDFPLFPCFFVFTVLCSMCFLSIAFSIL